jgi:hypothetical protein
MAKAGKKHTHRAPKPPLPDEQQKAEAEAKAKVKATAEKLRPFMKRLREDYERTAAEAAEMVKARKAVNRMIWPPPIPAAPAPTPAAPASTQLRPLKWITEEAERLKAQRVIYKGMGKAEFARILEGQMRTAVTAGLVRRSWSVRYIANQLSNWGLWPIND